MPAVAGRSVLKNGGSASELDRLIEAEKRIKAQSASNNQATFGLIFTSAQYENGIKTI